MKTTDEELNRWRTDNKRAPVSLRISGDEALALSYMGEAKVLLWSVKNAMSFNKLMQADGQRTMADGTIIRVKCVFGLDIVEIDVTQAVMGAQKQQCTITFINFPDIVPPMSNPGEVLDTDIEGIHYFKTYYLFDVSNCSTCRKKDKNYVVWKFLFTYSNPVEPRYYDDDPNNHSIDSLHPPCWAEVIKQDKDNNGDYIIWKAYTETGTISRSGLGVMSLSAMIRNGILDTDQIICSQQQQIDVDCCQKNTEDKIVAVLASNAQVAAWKAGCAVPPRSDCDSYPVCEGYWDWCEAPPELPLDALQTPTTFRARPIEKIYGEGEISPPGDGSCIPYIWTLDGDGSIETSGEYKDEVIYTPPSPLGCKEITISVKDRCNTVKQTHRASCCNTAGPLSIGYTSLSMPCNGTQTLTAIGGCTPYVWTLVSGGGTLVPSDDTKTALYTAPATNSNCANNPTINLIDCCGGSSDLSLSINCVGGIAGNYVVWVQVSNCTCTHSVVPPDAKTVYAFTVYNYPLNCDGTLGSASTIKVCSTDGSPPSPDDPIRCTATGGGTACYDCTFGANCGSDSTNPCCCYPFGASFTLKDYSNVSGINLTSGYHDKRTTTQKNNGCCPPQFM